MEVFGTVWDALCVSRKRSQDGSVAVFLQPQALLHSSWPSPWLQPAAHRQGWVRGLVSVGVHEPTLAHFHFPRSPAKVFPFRGRLVLCVLLRHRPSHVSLQFISSL